MPIKRTKIDFWHQLCSCFPAPGGEHNLSQGHTAAQKMRAVQAGQKVERAVGGIVGKSKSDADQLMPCNQLAQQKPQSAQSCETKHIFHHAVVIPARRNKGGLQINAGQDQKCRVQHKDTGQRQRAPNGKLLAHEMATKNTTRPSLALGICTRSVPVRTSLGSLSSHGFDVSL